MVIKCLMLLKKSSIYDCLSFIHDPSITELSLDYKAYNRFVFMTDTFKLLSICLYLNLTHGLYTVM